MKRTLFSAAFVVLLGAGSTFAQAPIERQAPGQTQAPAATDNGAPGARYRHHPKDPNKEAAHLARELNLTPDQQAKVAAAFADRDQKMADLRANATLEPQDARKQMHHIHKQSEEQLATILTPDQLQQMKAMHHEHGPRGQAQPLNPQPSA